MKEIGMDVTFEVDDFSNPKLLSSSEMLKNIAMFVLYSKKGQVPSLPSIGMNIEKQLYEFYEDVDPTSLQANVVNQCSALNAIFKDNGIEKMYEDGKPTLKISLEYSPNPETEKPFKDYQLGISYDELQEMISTELEEE